MGHAVGELFEHAPGYMPTFTKKKTPQPSLSNQLSTPNTPSYTTRTYATTQNTNTLDKHKISPMGKSVNLPAERGFTEGVVRAFAGAGRARQPQELIDDGFAVDDAGESRQKYSMTIAMGYDSKVSNLISAEATRGKEGRNPLNKSAENNSKEGQLHEHVHCPSAAEKALPLTLVPKKGHSSNASMFLRQNINQLWKSGFESAHLHQKKQQQRYHHQQQQQHEPWWRR